jgi:hypothetical protein
LPERLAFLRRVDAGESNFVLLVAVVKQCDGVTIATPTTRPSMVAAVQLSARTTMAAEM